MHELSIALNVVKTVNDLAVARGYERIDAVTLEIGELSGVDKAALSFAWDLATAGSRAAGSRLAFRSVELRVRCTACGVERHPPAMWQLACPTCPSVQPEIVAGRELNVVAVEVPT